MRPGRDRKLVTAALMLGMFLAAVEGTAVATAMPTAIGELGGVERYSWVFSAYLLTSTVTVPLYGKLADLYGRRRIYHASVALFLLGSALSGAAESMGQLIAFRAIQGLGAGGVLPVALTLVADIYTLEERGRIQGLFSGIWGVASLIGPAAGGLITEALSWRWVFYLNVPFGLASVLLIDRYLNERTERREHELDLPGTISLTAAVTALLVALLEGGPIRGWMSAETLALLGAGAACLGFFLWHERRAAEPILPPELFRSRVIAVASAGNVLIGTLIFSAAAFVPMYTQGVLGGSAIDAGMTLAPMSIGWPVASTLSGWLVLRFGYRALTVVGGAFALAGGVLLAGVGAATTRLDLMLIMLVTGLGMGFMSTPYLLAVQNAVPWRQRGVATSTTRFFRTLGGAVAVAALGAILNARLAASGVEASPNAALDPGLRERLSDEALRALTTALGNGLEAVYFAFALMAGAALAVTLLFPGGSAEAHAHAEAR